MRRSPNRWANETIGFQNDEFGSAMTTLFSRIKDQVKQMPSENKKAILYADDLQDLIFKRFGIRTKINFVTDSIGAIHVFPVNRNSILIKDYLRGNYKDASQELLLKMFNNKKGTIDNKNAVVSGIFSDYTHTIYLNVWHYFRNDILSPAEVTAILLHEVGHAFTFYSMSDRVSTANQVLANLTMSIKNGEDDEKQLYLFKELSDTYELTDKEFADLITDKNRIALGIRLFKHHVKYVEKQMPIDKYDETSSEQLADDFAVKFGYGKELVTALDKISTWSVEKSYLTNGLAMVLSAVVEFMIVPGIYIGLLLFLNGGIIMAAFFFLMYIFSFAGSGTVYRDMTYDDLKDRYQRIRNQMVANLNQDGLDKTELAGILENISFVDKAIDSTLTFNPLGTMLSDYFFSYNRSVKEDIRFQRLLEDLAHNELYVMSAKFKTI